MTNVQRVIHDLSLFLCTYPRDHANNDVSMDDTMVDRFLFCDEFAIGCNVD
jgi:hypothetical protein